MSSPHPSSPLQPSPDLRPSAAAPSVAELLAAAVAPAADTGLDPHLTAPSRIALFSVRAVAEPATLPRLLELFAKRGVVPTQVSARCSRREGIGPEAEGLVVDIAVTGMDRRLSDYVAACMRGMPCVQAVLTGDAAA